MRRVISLLVALALVSGFMHVTFDWIFTEDIPAVAPVLVGHAGTLILDAGHGGEDGGAVSLTGAPESHINLAIVLKMDAILGLYGVSPVLLRDQDISLHNSDAVTIREKKVSDLKNRVAIIQATEGATLMSIHQNSYPEEKYHGAQVFYSPTDGSQNLAQQIQTTILVLQPENNREIKKIPDTVYIMNHIDCPAVLVECGFLTNAQEESMLRGDTYQRKLAALLTSAWLMAPESL